MTAMWMMTAMKMNGDGNETRQEDFIGRPAQPPNHWVGIILSPILRFAAPFSFFGAEDYAIWFVLH